MRVGMLTGGGDAPGLNAVIRAVVRKGVRRYGDTVLGFRDGWRGLLDDDWVELDIDRLRGTLPRGGTVLGSSRETPFQREGGLELLRAAFERHALDGLVVVGGEGTLSCTNEVFGLGYPVVGVPKTIDNDIVGTDLTFGFQTAVQIATDAIDRLHTTAESHHRVMVVEVMGRHAGHIALWSGVAGGATVILIPEQPFDIDQVCEALRARHAAGRYASIVVVAEGATPEPGTLEFSQGSVDEFGHVRLGGIAHVVAAGIASRTAFDTKVTILGHVQRGGTPNAFDRMLSTSMGLAAIDAVHDGAFGHMVALEGQQIVRKPLAVCAGKVKTVDPALFEAVSVFFAS